MARDVGTPRGTEGRVRVRDSHYVYMACCMNGVFYTGYTANVERRIAAHNAGKGGSYTRSNRPVMLVAAWRFNSRIEALHAERFIKPCRTRKSWLWPRELRRLREPGCEQALPAVAHHHL